MSVVKVAPSNLRYYAAIGALLAVSVAVQVARDRGWQPYDPPAGVLWIRSGALAKRLVLGFDNIAADIYWIRTVVYFGGQRRADSGSKNYDQLYPMLDLVTTLDPNFRLAYRFGAIFLGEEFPGGAGRPDLAVQLLEKGLVNEPARWEYAQDIGFVHYWWSRDYERAAQWFKRAGEIPGGAEWLAPLAAVTLAEGGNRTSSRQLWTELRDHAEFEWIRESAERRLKQLDAMDAIDELNRSARKFIERHGKPPASWQQLAADQRWRGVPLDPGGTPYDLDLSTGVISLSTKSTLWPLPVGASVNVPQ